ncbi:MAG: hypothetical protein ABUK06_01910, partial [Dehalococcoidales bacterium]
NLSTVVVGSLTGNNKKWGLNGWKKNRGAPFEAPRLFEILALHSFLSQPVAVWLQVARIQIYLG